jgi:hypothetical protein
MFRFALVAGLISCALPVVEAQAPVAPHSIPVPATSQGAREVLAQVRPAVIQIKSFFGSNTAQASHGTGFAVKEGLSSGDPNYSHYVLTTSKLDAWRFAGRLSALTAAPVRMGSSRHVAPYACEDRIVGLTGFDAGLLVCTRRYRKLEGLHDFAVRVTSLNSSKQGFASHLDIYGVEFEPGMWFIRASWWPWSGHHERRAGGRRGSGWPRPRPVA